MKSQEALNISIETKKKVIVEVADMKISNDTNVILMTLALGSCVGLAVYDPVVKVGGMIHYMLPLSAKNIEKSHINPYMFGDTGIPILFRRLYDAGAKKENMRVVMAGGASVLKGVSSDIGNQNITIARRLLWKNQIIICKEDVGGDIPRTLYLDIESGKTWFSHNGTVFEL
jgi:chemotaxis protein CheD|uniref:Probable chemoreceptor glutamine deamidase CheD n=1 Tax=candidate division CPR3 bacterium TaxID=2268181 RepID=A0A7C5YUG7_UNCC3